MQKHEGEEWSSCVESVVGRDVCASAPELCRCGVPAGSAQGAGRGGGQVGRTDAGAVTELQAAGRIPAHRPRRGWTAEGAPSQQKEPGWRAKTKP